MRKIIIPLLFLLLHFIASSQTIRGKLKNVAGGKLYFTYTYDNAIYKTDTLQLKGDSNFTKTFNFNKYRKVNLKAGEASFDFVLNRGYDLIISGDASSWESLSKSMNISGKGNAANVEHLVNNSEQMKGLGWNYKFSTDSFVLAAVKWRMTKDSLRKAFVAQRAKKPFSADLQQYLRADSINDLYWSVNGFKDYNNVVLNGQSEKDAFFQQNIAPYIKSTDDEDYLNSNFYIGFWDGYIINYFRWKRNTADSSTLSTTHWMSFRFQEAERLTDGKLEKILLTNLLQYDLPYQYDYIKENEFSIHDSLFEVYAKKINNPEAYKLGITKINEQKEIRLKTKAGQPAIDFIVTDTTGKTYSLANFKNKVIYMDLWASWCGPCIAEIPDHKKLLEQFKDNTDIAFISISIDENQNDWIRNGINKHNPVGLQLWAGQGGWNSKFAKDYFIDGVPQYILIGKDGKFINFNAERPSSGDALKEAIIAALQ